MKYASFQHLTSAVDICVFQFLNASVARVSKGYFIQTSENITSLRPKQVSRIHSIASIGLPCRSLPAAADAPAISFL